ncbi:MAG: histidine kinase [Reichenbachiella sp.]|uniref:tetratricopeptide repeat-containing sensor histidine kinase n=1 Tax=Reichenbachiella sp. TaxID=2184521 RepID=UPI002966E5C1|nr:histidine kinase [Reichenbachiella sp.]MDW3210305.1 histidine kinase [Reichenbachiella sp.]
MIRLAYFFLIGAHSLIAQVPILDSLQIEIENKEVHDSLYVDLRNTFSKHCIYSRPSDSTLLEYAFETLQIAEEIEYPLGQIIANQRIATIHHYLHGESIKALEYYQRAVSITDRHSSLKKHMVGSLLNIGTIYTEQQDYDLALKIFKRVLNEFDGYAIPEQLIGNVFGELNELDSAAYYYKQAIHRAHSEKNFPVEANSLSNLSLVLSRAGYFEEATISIQNALKLVEIHQIEIVRPTAYLNASEVFLKAKKYDLAESYASNALELPTLQGNLFVQKSLYATLYDAYKAKKKYKEALSAHEQFKSLNDSITASDRRVEFTKKDLAFESERKDLLAQAEISKQKLINKTYLISGGGIIGALFLISFLVWQKQKVVSKGKESEFKKNLAESKLTTLRAQINPHFIFNALNSIDQYMFKHGAEKASNYLVKFSKLMRSILENSTENWIMLDEEITLIKTYVEIESLRLNNTLKFDIEVDQEINKESTLVPSLFIQPFLENSIEHGISKKDGLGEISVNMYLENQERLTCIIEDNGIGRFISTPSHKGKSMGMEIAQNRIDYLNQLTNQKTHFELQDLEQGLRVIISIPYQIKF